MRTRGTFSRDAGRTATTGIYALISATPLPPFTLTAGPARLTYRYTDDEVHTLTRRH